MNTWMCHAQHPTRKVEGPQNAIILPYIPHFSNTPYWRLNFHVLDCALIFLFHLSGRLLVPLAEARQPHFRSATN
jgi:hypothetical protein